MASTILVDPTLENSSYASSVAWRSRFKIEFEHDSHNGGHIMATGMGEYVRGITHSWHISAQVRGAAGDGGVTTQLIAVFGTNVVDEASSFVGNGSRSNQPVPHSSPVLFKGTIENVADFAVQALAWLCQASVRAQALLEMGNAISRVRNPVSVEWPEEDLIALAAAKVAGANVLYLLRKSMEESQTDEWRQSAVVRAETVLDRPLFYRGAIQSPHMRYVLAGTERIEA